MWNPDLWLPMQSQSASGTIYVMLQTLISSIVFYSKKQQPEQRMYIK